MASKTIIAVNVGGCIIPLGLAIYEMISRLVKYAGLAFAFFVLPALAFLDAGAMILLPLLSMVKAGKVAESATDY